VAIYKRGKKYWYKFMFDGELVRESTKQGNDRVAREIEAAHRSRLAKGRDERDAATERLKCISVLMCPECKDWYDPATAVEDEGQSFCGPNCRSGWKKKHTVVPTLVEFCDKRFGPWAQATSAPKTWRDFYLVGLNAIRRCSPLATKRLDEITSEHVAEFAAYRRAQGSTRKSSPSVGVIAPLKTSSVNGSLRVLRRVLRVAEEWGVLASAPKIKLIPGEEHRERVITLEEEMRYLAAAPRQLASLAAVLVDTGMRPEELFRLRWEYLDWTTGRNGTLLVPHGKTEAARRVLPLTPRVRGILETRWEAARRPLDGWVWIAPTRSGHIEPSSIKKQHTRTFQLINVEATKQNQPRIKPFVLYSLRHTFLTRLGSSGCDVWTLARIAGHSSIRISSRYVHPGQEQVLSAMSRLGGHKSGHSAEDANAPSVTKQLPS
jgi:integrase